MHFDKGEKMETRFKERWESPSFSSQTGGRHAKKKVQKCLSKENEEKKQIWKEKESLDVFSYFPRRQVSLARLKKEKPLWNLQKGKANKPWQKYIYAGCWIGTLPNQQTELLF